MKVTRRADSATAPGLQLTLQSLLDANRQRIVLDMCDTECLSSAGIRIIITMLKAAKLGGGELKLARPAPRVREVLDLASLTPIVNIPRMSLRWSDRFISIRPHSSGSTSARLMTRIFLTNKVVDAQVWKDRPPGAGLVVKWDHEIRQERAAPWRSSAVHIERLLERRIGLRCVVFPSSHS